MKDLLNITVFLSLVIFTVVLSIKIILFICTVPQELITIRETLQKIELQTRVMQK